MRGLFLHCGAERVSYDDIKRLPEPKPLGESHTPIHHDVLIRGVTDALTETGYKIVEAAHSLSHGGARYFGLLRVEGGGEDKTKDYGNVVGLRNSDDKSFSSKLGAGGGVFVCDNLSFSAEVVIARRHTKNILRDLPAKIGVAVSNLPKEFHNMSKRVEVYNERPLTKAEAHDLILKSYKAGSCTTSAIGKVLKEYEDPTHEDFRNRNAWSLFNAFTEVGKGNLKTLPYRTSTLHKVFDRHCGIKYDSETGIVIG